MRAFALRGMARRPFIRYNEVLEIGTSSSMKTKKHKPKIGLALGGGGARGIAHLGVLQVFEENKIPISIISGTSMGAIIGGCYAAGNSLQKIERVIKRLSKEKMFAWSNIHLFRESLLKSGRIGGYLKSLINGMDIKDTAIPFVAVGVDLESGKEVDMREGELLKALMASSSFPPLFPPVFFNGHYMIDGGILNNIPVNVIRPEVDIVVGVQLKNYISQQFIS
ncbi:MAG: patatin-like phospholipase family protein, partial [Patescibacteria group bacterium]